MGAEFLQAAMRDRASVNNVALTTLKLVDIGCYSHTINHVGERFSTLTLSLPGYYFSPIALKLA